MRVAKHSRFNKKLKRIPRDVRLAFADRLELFRSDPRHPLLNDHALTGDRTGYRSINITGDWRAIYELVSPDIMYFTDIDTHHNLYGT